MTSDRRERRTEQRIETQSQANVRRKRGNRQLGTEGARPPGPFGGLPVSEIAILAGVIGAVVGFLQGGGAALYAGLAVCALGVIEVTAREHFSGFRSHSSLLAGIPAMVAGIVIFSLVGQPRQRSLVLLIIVPIYGSLFWFLRQRFRRARQARVRRSPVR